MAEHEHTASPGGIRLISSHEPTPLAARLYRPVGPIQVTLHQPGKIRRSPHRVITGRLVGEMHMRGELHHYRVVGDNGVLYMAPPHWLARECRSAVSDVCITARLSNPAPTSQRAERMALLAELAAQWGISRGEIVAGFGGLPA